LSEEEVRGLLGDPGNGSREPASDRAAPVAGELRVLVVSRDEGQVQLLRGVLGSLPAEVVAVKNPFSALDRLRLQRYSGVISDFDLWAEKGKLLFSRLASSGSLSPVVFICGSHEEATAARKSGAIEVLRRPIQPADLLRAMGSFGREVERRHSSEVDSRQPTADRTEDGSKEVKTPPPAVPPAPAAGRRPPGGSQDAPSGEPAAIRQPPANHPQPTTADELPWLRFFFESKRALRKARSRSERFHAILACFSREIAPRSSGLGIALEEGWWILARPGSQEALARIGRALSGSLAGSLPAHAPASAGVGGGAESSPTEHLVARWSAGVRPAVFVALHHTDRVPEKYLAELAALLAEAESSPPGIDTPRGE
jgi:CheY-like chemotaxis protein